ncbi:A/G-specific adenine glycosylase [bacterium]|nr:A/G-specific adenine glycosylase [bacterium]
MIITSSEKKCFQGRLLRWFHKNQRKMPWRGIQDPYKTWISEIMLQQTQVETVIPYYLNFIHKFPTVKALANAALFDVMKAWEGLGYYARARNLHSAANTVCMRHQGRIPDTLDGLMSLPGIGPYTAGAILSIAYRKPVPVLDGNIIRVFSRYFQLTESVDNLLIKKKLWLISKLLLPDKYASDFNQGLMELGSLICTPKNPDCEKCPVMAGCKARKLEIQSLLPVRSPKKPIPHFDVTAGVIYKNNKILITLRPAKGLLGSLWEFPGGKKEAGETLEGCLRREIMEELRIRIRIIRKLTQIRHAYTHFKITLHVYQCRYIRGTLQCHACDDFRWIQIEELTRFPFPAADKKVIDLLLEKNRPDPSMRKKRGAGINPRRADGP